MPGDEIRDPEPTPGSPAAPALSYRLRRRSSGEYLRLDFAGGRPHCHWSGAPEGPAYTDFQLLRDDARASGLAPDEVSVVVYEGGVEAGTVDLSATGPRPPGTRA